MFVSNGSLVLKTPFNAGTTSSWFPSMPPMSGGWPTAYGQIYRRQLWVYVVVSKRARATARLPLPVYAHDDLSRPKVEDHPMAKLLTSPNPALSGFGLWVWTSSTYDIYGEAFWLKKRRKGTVTGLFPLHPASMTYDERAETWRFDNGRLVLEDIPDADLVHFRAYDPESQTCGMSPLEPLRATLENEWAARTATSSFWRKGARPGYVLTHPMTLSAAAQQRVSADFDSKHGGAENTGSTLVLEEGMKPERLTLSAEEAQYIETRKLNREEVCAAYDIPPPVVHILDHATFSNITEQMRSMYRDTMAPHLKGFEAAIEVDLRAPEWPSDDVYAEFLMDEVLRGDFEARQEALAKAAHMTIAEKRKVENLPFIEGTDRIFLNTATMPLDAIDAQAAALVAQARAKPRPGPVQLPANVIPMPTARAVMGRLSWQRHFSDIDPSALVDQPGDVKDAVQTAYNAERCSRTPTVAGFRDRIQAMAGKDIQARQKAQTDHETTVRATLTAFFARQGPAVLADGFDSARWDAELADDLHKTALVVSAAVGQAVVTELGLDAAVYDVDRTVAFLRSVAERLAGTINTTTKAQLEATDDKAAVFSMAEEARAAGIATAATTLISGFAAVEAGRRAAETDGRSPTKTWVTGRNPRASHAALNGQTVPLEKPFSNGMQWPGEFGPPEETAGCNCRVEIT